MEDHSIVIIIILCRNPSKPKDSTSLMTATLNAGPMWYLSSNCFAPIQNTNKQKVKAILIKTEKGSRLGDGLLHFLDVQLDVGLHL